MTAYLFWHRPFADVALDAYEAALTAFHRALVARGCPDFEGSATYRIAATPWPSSHSWACLRTTALLSKKKRRSLSLAGLREGDMPLISARSLSMTRSASM